MGLQFIAQGDSCNFTHLWGRHDCIGFLRLALSHLRQRTDEKKENAFVILVIYEVYAPKRCHPTVEVALFDSKGV